MAALCQRLDAPELAPLRELMLLWAQQVAQRRFTLAWEIEDMAEMDRLHESGEFETSLRPRARPERERLIAESWARGYAEGMAKVRAKGWAEDLYRELTMAQVSTH